LAIIDNMSFKVLPLLQSPTHTNLLFNAFPIATNK